MKDKHIVLIVFIILIVIIAVLVTLKYTTTIFNKKQPSKKQAIKEGYGYYSDPITTTCLNKVTKTTDCNKPSTYKIINHCIPHPVTQKGCLGSDGTMTYESKVQELPCNIACVGSYLREEDGIKLKKISPDLHEVLGSGCNNVVNKYTGLNYTSYFLGDYNVNKGGYNLKECIPGNNFIGYKEKTLTCTDTEVGGKNNCNITCGAIPTLKFNGKFGLKLSKNVLQYFPVDYDQDGVRRNVCYDLNGVNQVEILNNTEEVPADFVFPNKCYNIFNSEDNINFNNYYPIGTSSTSRQNTYYSRGSEFFLVDLNNSSLENITGISSTYEGLYVDYNNYIIVKLGEEDTLLQNMYSNNFDNYIGVCTSDVNGFFGNFYYPSPVPSSYQIRGGGNVTLTPGTSVYIDGISYNQLDSNINSIFRSNTPEEIPYFWSGVSSILYFSSLPSYLDSDTYVYYLQKDTMYNNTGKLVKLDGISAGSSIAYISSKLIPQSDYDTIYLWAAYGVSVSEEFYPQNLYSTGNLHLKDGISYTENNLPPELINVYSSTPGISAYYYFGSNGGNPQFYYPLYGTSTSIYNTSYNFGLSITMWGKANTNYNIGPSSRDIYPLEIDIGTVQVTPLISDNSPIPYGSFVISPGINYTLGTSVYNSSNNYGVSLTAINTNVEDKTFLQLIRSDSPKLNTQNIGTIGQNNTPGDRIATYYSIIRDEISLSNTTMKDFDITVLQKQNYVLVADYEIFQSPYVVQNDGQLTKLCFDENNKALKSGTVVTLNKGQKAIYNQLCFDYNTVDGVCATCGDWVLESNNIPCVQNTSSNTPDYELNCEPINKGGNYFNSEGFMEEGINIDNRKLKCNGNKCADPFFTDEISTSKIYELNEETYRNKERKEYYLSLTNNNNFDPLNPIYWSRIYPYNAGELVKEGEKFFIKPDDQNTLYVYECTHSGIAPFGLNNLNINFQYLKEEPVYTTQSNSGLSITRTPVFQGSGNTEAFSTDIFPGLSPGIWDRYGASVPNYYSSYIYAGKFPNRDTYQKFINDPYNITFTLYSTYTNSLSVDINIPNFPVNNNSIFNPSFGVWNKYITSIFKTTNRALFFTYYSGEMPNSIRTGEYIETIDGSSVKAITLKKGDYLVGIPSNLDVGQLTQGSGSDKIAINNSINVANYPTLGYYNYKQGYLWEEVCIIDPYSPPPTNVPDNEITDNSNYISEYELISIEEVNVDGNGTSYRVKRNALNTPTNNLNNQQSYIDKGFDKLLLFYIPLGFVNLKYPIKSSDSDNTIITVTSNVNSTLGISPSTIVKENMSGITYNNNNPVISQLTIDGTSAFQNYFVNRIIENNITYPIVIENNNQYYILGEGQLFSTITEIYPYSNTFYLSEYLPDNNSEYSFNTSDNIELDLNGVIFNFFVTSKNVRFNNKNYSYECTIQNGTSTEFVSIFENSQIYSYYLKSSEGVYYIPSVIGTSTRTQDLYFGFIKENNYDNTVEIEKYIGGSIITIPSDNYFNYGIEPYDLLLTFAGTSTPPPPATKDSTYYGGSFYWLNTGPGCNNGPGWKTVGESPPPNVNLFKYVNPTDDANRIDYDYWCKYQYYLDEGKLATFSLKSTNFYLQGSDEYITVDFLETKGKPPGPTYIKELPNSNVLDKSGYGYIQSFQFSQTSNNNVNPGIYISKGGFTLTNTLEDIAQFNFVASRENFTTFPTYNNTSTQYIINDAIEYTNYNQRQYFRNDKGISTFNETSWTQVPESIFPENNVIQTLQDNRLYFPGETVRVGNTIYGISTATLGSTFPSNFTVVTPKDVFTSYNNEFYLITNNGASPTASQVNNYIINNLQSLPLAYQNYNTLNTYYCPKPCYGISFKDFNNNSYLASINSSISPSFFNNVYISSYSDSASDDMWSLSNVPFASPRPDSITFLQNSNDSFVNNLYPQYIFDIPTPTTVKNGFVACSGTCFSLPNKIFSNGLLLTMIPQDLETQDLIKYNVQVSGVSQYITTNPLIPSPVNATTIETIESSSSVYSEQTLTVREKTSYIKQHGGLNLSGPSYGSNYSRTITLNLTDGTNNISLNPSVDDFYYLPFYQSSQITNGGTSYQFGDLWYLNNNTTDSVIAHGYLDPIGTSLNIHSFIPIQLPNSDSISGTSYGISFVTDNGRDFAHNSFDFSTKRLLWNIPFGTSSSVAGEYYTDRYILDGVSFTFGTSFVIDYTPQYIDTQILQRTIGVSPSGSALTQNSKIYQKRENDDIKVKIYTLFGSEFLSQSVYDSSKKIISTTGDEYPGIIFKPLRNNYFDSAPDTFEVLHGNSTTAVESFQNIFQISKQGTSFSLRCNPYNYPLNIQDNYSFTIGGTLSPTAFNRDSIYGSSFSPLNVIQTTNPSKLIGKSSQGISFNMIETINELFFKDLFNLNQSGNLEQFGVSSRDLLFGQLRQNNLSTYYDTALNCSLFFTADNEQIPFIIDESLDISYTGGSYYYTKSGTSTNISNPTCIKNYAFKLDQTGMNDNPIILSASSSNEGTSITVSGGNDFYLLDSGEKLYVYYFLQNNLVERDDYYNMEYFNSEKSGIRSKFINITLQENLGNISGQDFTLYLQDSQRKVAGSIKFVSS